ncbi:MAG: hypothetical protein P1U90_18300 [Akkermansiaceae bacterium]|nr:hypothetical protein [Akkermansiaceae bacterium]
MKIVIRQGLFRRQFIWIFIGSFLSPTEKTPAIALLAKIPFDDKTTLNICPDTYQSHPPPPSGSFCTPPF